MQTRTLIGTVIVVIVLIGLAAVYYGWKPTAAPAQNTQETNATSTMTDTTSDGTITFAHSPEFGLATNPQQVLVHTYIPPCGQSFDYCLYYNGDAYQGTNFESAGLSISKRPDIANERLCLDTPPQGYNATVTPGASTSTSAYSASVFSPIGDAAAGHYANGSVYRLWVRSASKCYELETLIGETQYANYPAGSIKQFTADDEHALQDLLRKQLDSVMITADNIPVAFPLPPVTR